MKRDPHETWVRIDSHPDYAVSSLGQIKRTRKAIGTLTKGNSSADAGHMIVTLSDKRPRRNRLRKVHLNDRKHYVHRLVAKHFLPPAPPDKPLAVHLDHDFRNNRFWNLAWMSEAEMRAHRKAAGLSVYANNPRGSLSPYLAEQIRARHFEGGESIRSLAKYYGVKQSAVQFIVHYEHYA